jgi:glutathione S-transferase
MIHFYGSPMSSAGRTHVMLEECGVPYEYHQVNLRDPASKAEYLKINPGGKVPFLVDGDVKIPESIAINFYLAEKYAPHFWAAELAERAQIYAWSLWGISTLQAEALRVLHHLIVAPEDQRSSYEVEHGKKQVQRYCDHLEAQLPDSGFLVGHRYTVADINVASVVNLCVALGAAHLGPKSTAWMATSKARPAWQKAAAAG